MQILDKVQIGQKIERLAYEILEQNYDEKALILAGINDNGMAFAGLLQQALTQISEKPVLLAQIRLNPARPLDSEIEISLPVEELKQRAVIVVDDVANTGRTIFFAMRPLLETIPGKVQVAVLVDRKHKSFPIAVDFVGLSLATTLHEDIDVRIRDTDEWVVYLN